ncbi:MAG: hypothetical protein ACKVG0_09765, partial [Alphaproteobacteria bacterium]
MRSKSHRDEPGPRRFQRNGRNISNQNYVRLRKMRFLSRLTLIFLVLAASLVLAAGAAILM